MGFPRSAFEVCWFRCLLLTGRHVGHENAENEHSSRLQYRFGQAFQPLALVIIHDLYRRFRYLHPASYLALIQVVVPRRTLFSRFASRTLQCFVTLSGQLLIHAPRFTW